MKIEIIGQHFSVCKVEDFHSVNWNDPYCFIGKTEEECSLVCQTESVPENVLEREDGWKAFRFSGVLDFSMVGVLSQATSILAGEGISVFAVSTYNTDYVLLKEGQFGKALELLEKNGYTVDEKQQESSCKKAKG